MSHDRLAELQRQRELVRAHLAWLDQEIASALGRPAPNAPLPPTAPPPIEAVHVTDVEPSPDPLSAAADAKRGCFIAALTVAAIGLLALVAIYFLWYRDRPLL